MDRQHIGWFIKTNTNTTEQKKKQSPKFEVKGTTRKGTKHNHLSTK